MADVLEAVDMSVDAEVRKRIDAVFRPDPPEEETLLGGMADWAKELDDEFLAKVRYRAQVREVQARSVAALPQNYETDAESEKVRADVWAARRNIQRPTLPPAKVPRHVDHIFSGSVGATYGPPYDVQWTWSQQQGDPPNPQVSADATSGTMELLAQTLDDTSAVAARAAVGNWLAAPLGTSTMNVFAAPAVNWDWLVAVLSNWGESAGWLGFVVQSFDRRSGNLVDTVIKQQIPVWDKQLNAPSFPWPGWIQSSSDQGSTSAFSLQAQFMAIEGLFYTVWVWFGVYAAEGDQCIAQFSPVTVPFFTWQNG